jgi:hypothetical protein
VRQTIAEAGRHQNTGIRSSAIRAAKSGGIERRKTTWVGMPVASSIRSATPERSRSENRLPGPMSINTSRSLSARASSRAREPNIARCSTPSCLRANTWLRKADKTSASLITLSALFPSSIARKGIHIAPAGGSRQATASSSTGSNPSRHKSVIAARQRRRFSRLSFRQFINHRRPYRPAVTMLDRWGIWFTPPPPSSFFRA